MKLALQQAQRVLGKTKTNPAVGCIIVKENKVISAGFTSVGGRPHAEYNAINSSKFNIKKADLYVTLEPCSHYGKTPPCVKSIIKNKFKKVYFSVKDPDIRSYNKSTKILNRKKIKVNNGIYQSKIKNFYYSYFKYKKDFMPFVTGKIATSKDFFTINKKNRWITNEYSRGRVHLMRSNHDCILTSVNTVINDNPKLTCRILGLENTSPTRIILDKNLNIPINSYVIKSSNTNQTIIFYNKNNKKKIKSLKKMNVKMINFPLNTNGNFNLKKILKKIKKLGFSRVFIECGLNLITNFLHNNLVDVMHIFVSKTNLGINGKLSFKKTINSFLKKRKFTYEKINLDGDKLISYNIKNV